MNLYRIFSPFHRFEPFFDCRVGAQRVCEIAMIALLLLTSCAALRSYHEDWSADIEVPHAVNCQMGVPEKGCASICHWLEAWTVTRG